MNITLTYFGQLRQLAGVESETRTFEDGASLTGLLEDVAAGHGERFGAILFDENHALRPSVMILVNETPVDKGSLPSLSDQDKVSLLPAIAGG